MVSDASSSFLDYLVYNQGCIKFDIYFSSLAEISLMFHWVILSIRKISVSVADDSKNTLKFTQ